MPSTCSEAVAGEAVDHLDECLTSGMLTLRGASVAFRHELARLAVEDSLPPQRRAALHARALAALVAAARAPDLARLAHHAALSETLEERAAEPAR